jgi:hypothetical protein
MEWSDLAHEMRARTLREVEALSLRALVAFCSRLDPISVLNVLTPVALPPGGFMLATGPSFIGSLPVNTIR